MTGYVNTTLGKTEVQVQQGNTLKTISKRVYGSDGYWYVLADANGMDSEDALTAGITLTVPELKTNANDASTFKPYDSSEVTGPTTPNLPYMPPPDAGCRTLGVVVMVAISVVVGMFKFGVGGILLANALSQAAGSAMGVASFSWKTVLENTAVDVVTYGVGSALSKTGMAASTIQLCCNRIQLPTSRFGSEDIRELCGSVSQRRNWHKSIVL